MQVVIVAMMAEHRFDKQWTMTKIRLLMDGIALVMRTDEFGEEYESVVVGETAYAQRCRAYDRGNPEDILEPAQLDVAIKHGIVKDRNVRLAMLLLSHGVHEHYIDHFFLDKDKRRGSRLLDRGIELVRRYERDRFHQLARNNSGEGRERKPVCWRCCKNEVTLPGEDCGDVGIHCPSLHNVPGFGSGRHPKPTEKMTLGELTASQERGTIPGEHANHKHVRAKGLRPDSDRFRTD